MLVLDGKGRRDDVDVVDADAHMDGVIDERLVAHPEVQIRVLLGGDSDVRWGTRRWIPRGRRRLDRGNLDSWLGPPGTATRDEGQPQRWLQTASSDVS